METEKQIAVMTAYMTGKKIEWAYKNSDVWYEEDRPAWNWDECKYRIMNPTSWRAYNGMQEMIEAVKKHGTMVTKSDLTESICYFDDKILRLSLEGTTGYDELLSQYRWLDDTRCGVEEIADR